MKLMRPRLPRSKWGWIFAIASILILIFIFRISTCLYGETLVVYDKLKDCFISAAFPFSRTIHFIKSTKNVIYTILAIAFLLSFTVFYKIGSTIEKNK